VGDRGSDLTIGEALGLEEPKALVDNTTSSMQEPWSGAADRPRFVHTAESSGGGGFWRRATELSPTSVRLDSLCVWSQRQQSALFARTGGLPTCDAFVPRRVATSKAFLLVLLIKKSPSAGVVALERWGQTLREEADRAFPHRLAVGSTKGANIIGYHNLILNRCPNGTR
jgi:hypothetical protein